MSPETELDRVLIAVGRKMQTLLRRELRHELTLTQAWVLNALEHHQHLQVSEIAEALDLSLSAASNVIDQLIHAGWVVRERSRQDRRIVTVTLTEDGRHKLNQAKGRRRDVWQHIVSQLEERDVHELKRILHKLESALSADEDETADQAKEEI